MKYIYIDANEILNDNHDKYFCVTTNQIIKKNKTAVMGAGIAKIINDRYPETAVLLGKYLSLEKESNFKYVHFLGRYEYNRILSFQTKYHWKDDSNIELIIKSCYELIEIYDKKYINNNLPIYLPLPGCSNGRLNIDFVKENINPILNKIDNLFIFNKQ